MQIHLSAHPDVSDWIQPPSIFTGLIVSAIVWPDAVISSICLIRLHNRRRGSSRNQMEQLTRLQHPSNRALPRYDSKSDWRALALNPVKEPPEQKLVLYCRQISSPAHKSCPTLLTAPARRNINATNNAIPCFAFRMTTFILVYHLKMPSKICDPSMIGADIQSAANASVNQ